MCTTAARRAQARAAGRSAALTPRRPRSPSRRRGLPNGTGTALLVGRQRRQRYAWTDYVEMPQSGRGARSAQEPATAGGLTLASARRAQRGSNGSGIARAGTYATTGATTYAWPRWTLGMAQSPAPGSTPPSLTVSEEARGHQLTSRWP